MRCYLFTFLIFSSLELLAVCSQHPIPATWEGLTSTLPGEARLQIAEDALQLLLPQVNTSSQISDLVKLNNEAAASATWVIVLQDYLNNSTVNEVQATNNLVSIQSILDSFVINSDLLLWGLVSSYAFRAYNKPLFLNLATIIWNDVAPYFILPHPASSSQQNESTAIQPTCGGATTSGAILWDRENPEDLQVNAETMGPFVALSAYLLEATQNATYMSYAKLATTFIQAHLFDGQIIADTIDIGSCTVTPSNSSSTAFTYNSGFVIEAWSVLADVTQNDTLRAILDDLVYTSATSTLWTNALGVNTESPGSRVDGGDRMGGFKALFIRGLHTSWMRSDPTSDIAQFVAAYITIQYNALLNQAAQASQPNIYSAQWFDGSATSFQTYPQAIALHVLSPAITLASNSSSNTSTPDTQTQTSPPESPPNLAPNTKTEASVGARAGIIAGVITAICSVIALAALAALLVYRRRKTARQSGAALQDTTPTGAIEPFTSLLSTTASTVETPLSHHPHRSKDSQQSPRQLGPVRSPDTEHSSWSGPQTEDVSSHSERQQQPDDADIRRLSQTVLTLLHALQTQNLYPAPPTRGEGPPQYEP